MWWFFLGLMVVKKPRTEIIYITRDPDLARETGALLVSSDGLELVDEEGHATLVKGW